MGLRKKSIIAALSPFIFLAFIACGGDDKDQPAPGVVNLNCGPNSTAAVTTTTTTSTTSIPGSAQLAVIPPALPQTPTQPQQITVQPGQKQTASCPEHPDDLASRLNLQNLVSQAGQTCSSAYAANAASLVPLALSQASPQAAQAQIQAAAASGLGTPVNQGAQAQCQNLITQINLVARTMGNGQYINQPGVKEWLAKALGKDILNGIASNLQSAGINPQAILSNPTQLANATAAGQAYYNAKIAPIVNGSIVGTAAAGQLGGITF